MTLHETHHLIIGGCGAVGVTFASFLRKSGKISVYVRENHVTRLKSQETPSLAFYDLSSRLTVQILIFISCFSSIVFAILGNLSWPFSLSLFLFATRGLPPLCAHLHRFINPLKKTLIPLESAVSTPEDITTPVTHIWIALSSVALREMSDEINRIIHHCRSLVKLDTTVYVVNLSPSALDMKYLMSSCPTLTTAPPHEGFGRVECISSSLPIIAFQTPLEGGSSVNIIENGGEAHAVAVLTSKYLPFDLAPCDNEQDSKNAAMAVGDLLSSCGCTVSHHTANSFTQLTTVSESIFTSLVLSVESSGWSFDVLSFNPLSVYRMIRGVFECKKGLELVSAAEQDLITQMDFDVKQITIENIRVKFKSHCNYLDLKCWALFAVVYPLLGLITFCRYFLVPFDLEVYFMYHFRKVSVQMHSFAMTSLIYLVKLGADAGALVDLMDNCLRNQFEEKLSTMTEAEIRELARHVRERAKADEEKKNE
eukprot:GDKJ01011845.1.p1 GENE.GDKJ01011845.1~~GDKJ01011845.1.p1  ORF type:complete len:489 (-),score=90.47 GDKJ01011845.1:1153-2595(-)